ncbi:hypothetical protein GLOIN_2v1766884 [Rhizophagus irregularis DAOM 181602=DAOM 197198]|uniref:HAT C-terminal dimerisation domain-containing protein n=3 Tax=Rhizophagus irregularis TaxID=588596 RepID=A0A2P4QLB6_RHIID|nr:hypothetical protein GLOIN_2v1766884 [Rhizophagus irregularis DAOM 181602=DAOM 197198]POG78410.1 hypothetical protein GLOIN_2v1766884 [Rhizophagus irregularis DAOM 181602=DAOM 197198]|eukprot:XP_025185276.1 hypothetical protein GLOIN_2v1766884 [Rhizophagus irregularis DAOM 181602=DAOM 197198]
MGQSAESVTYDLFWRYPGSYLKQNIKEIITRRFFMDAEELQLILKPIKEAIKYLEMKNATLADSFNKRWTQFDFRLYMLAYLLHPLYHGKGFRNQVCRKVVYWAIENIWIKMDGRENSSSKLIGQIAAFRNNLPPYNDEFIPKYYTVEHWWNYVEQDEGEENFIQQLALKVFSITPHNAGCERIFSVMGWYINKRRTRLSVNHLQNLTKLHTYYVSNAKTELKYTAKDMNAKNDEEFYQLVRNGIYQNINDEIEEKEFDGEDEDYDDTEDELVDIDEYEKFGYKNNDNVLQNENYFNFVSRELVELLKLQEPQVIIEPVNSDHIIDHGNKNFDIEELLDQQFNDDDNV